jgi:hypothetical protein
VSELQYITPLADFSAAEANWIKYSKSKDRRSFHMAQLSNMTIAVTLCLSPMAWAQAQTAEE